MDSGELNKILGGVLAAFLVMLLLNFAGAKIYGTGAHHGEEQLAFAVEIEEPTGGGGDKPELDIGALLAAGDAEKGAKVFKKCGGCHKLDKNGTGPMLAGLVARDIGSVDGFDYSKGLSDAEGDWTPEQLFAFLGNPKGFGSSMSFNLRKEADIANVIKYLESQ